jgi:hypothetical protein
MVRGAALLRPGDVFAEPVSAVMPAVVATCDRAVYESLVG